MHSPIRLYVDSRHEIGGVTTWALQVSQKLLSSADVKVIAVRTHPNNPARRSMFPESVVTIPAGSSLGVPKTIHIATDEMRLTEPPSNDTNTQEPSPNAAGAGIWDAAAPIANAILQGPLPAKPTLPTKQTLPTKPTLPTLSTKRTLPTKPSLPTLPTQPKRPTLPTNPTLPTKPTLPDLTKLPRDWDDLDDIAKREVEKAELFIPNYVDAGYRHAALSRVRKANSRCIGYCHTDEDHYYSLLKRYEPIIQTFVVVSRRCKDQLTSMLPHRESDVHIVPYGVSIGGQPRQVPVGGSLRLIYSGRIVKKQKRILDFLILVDLLEKRRVNYRLDFVGTGSDEIELRDALKSYSNVRFLEAVPYDDMHKIYPNYDALVLTSESEGLSIAMLEAMSFGVVPVVTRVSGSEDVIVDGENGFLCDVGDLKLMSDRVEQLANNRRDLAAMSQEAFKIIQSRYTSKNHLRLLHDILEQIMSKPLAPVDAAASCLL